MLPLYEGAQPCVGSGFCCKVGPCPFGTVTSRTNPTCIHLKEIEQEDGKHPRYTCGIAAEIVGKPGWENAPAFGAGCCSTMGNTARNAIIRELRNSPDLDGDLKRHHLSDH